MGKTLTSFTIIVIALILSLSGVAFAATSQDIYDDYADNGKLDGQYTAEELEAYLNDATMHQYGSEVVTEELDVLAQSQTTRSEFPFTGAELALMIGGAAVLIGAGVALRRASR